MTWGPQPVANGELRPSANSQWENGRQQSPVSEELSTPVNSHMNELSWDDCRSVDWHFMRHLEIKSTGQAVPSILILRHHVIRNVWLWNCPVWCHLLLRDQLDINLHEMTSQYYSLDHLISHSWCFWVNRTLCRCLSKSHPNTIPLFSHLENSNSHKWG